MGVKYRLGKDSDRRALPRVHELSASQAYGHIFSSIPFPTAETESRWLVFEGDIVVAEAIGEVVGFAAWNDQELCALYVLPEWQGRGVGTALLARSGGTNLWVLKDNSHGRRFYEKHGWLHADEERRAYGVTELLYQRPCEA